jgi:MFS transporter, DHA1 family, multidrug resistance protein
MASAVIGTASTAGGAALGAVLDRLFDGTIRPLAIGFSVLGLVALGLVAWAERGRLMAPRPDSPPV